VCGDGVQTLGEQCDDANVISGDGCDANCTTTACGNGIMTIGEECDDGNVASGDCCDATCHTEAVGNPCDDGQACTTDDACAAGGICAGNSCEPCRACIPGVGCGDPPGTSCYFPDPQQSSTTIKDAKTDTLAWSWQLKAPFGGSGFFGDPTVDSSYALCVYGGTTDATLAATAAPGCTAASCWSPTKDGYKYAGKVTKGSLKLKLSSTAGSRTKLTLSAKGPLLRRPPLPPQTPVTIRLYQSVDDNIQACWEATYGNNIKKNLPDRFQAKSN
jgi:cysteine-rich repeat protein